MTHEDVLNLLFPVELTGMHTADAAREGAALDDAQTSAERILTEMFPDMTHTLLADWERVCALTPDQDAPLQVRRNAVLKKLREIGGLSRSYFIILAATYGWTITIDELLPFMAGWGRCGDPLYEEEVRWIWRVNVAGSAVYSFRAGLSAAGERLTWWNSNTVLEALLTDLKPAHTVVIFNYT
ncbi:MAG: hypothetical protein A4E68_01945 [Syntrophaceae bacterium PtaB.Bin095]|jgi:uncharacterized protein YmfQ (DUF2313 family)|nr:MAG: hypothetical protein A4E68_01945 [Syntrophaceae bacterium PtaB.Bin095]